jgi:hypothetical protein
MEINNPEITRAKERIAEAQSEIEQLKNRATRLIQRVSREERKARTRRLIERGAILESVITDAEKLTNDQIKRALRAAFQAKTARDELAAIRTESPSS